MRHIYIYIKERCNKIEKRKQTATPNKVKANVNFSLKFKKSIFRKVSLWNRNNFLCSYCAINNKHTHAETHLKSNSFLSEVSVVIERFQNFSVALVQIADGAEQLQDESLHFNARFEKTLRQYVYGFLVAEYRFSTHLQAKKVPLFNFELI